MPNLPDYKKSEMLAIRRSGGASSFQNSSYAFASLATQTRFTQTLTVPTFSKVLKFSIYRFMTMRLVRVCCQNCSRPLNSCPRFWPHASTAFSFCSTMRRWRSDSMMTNNSRDPDPAMYSLTRSSISQQKAFSRVQTPRFMSRPLLFPGNTYEQKSLEIGPDLRRY